MESRILPMAAAYIMWQKHDESKWLNEISINDYQDIPEYDPNSITKYWQSATWSLLRTWSEYTLSRVRGLHWLSFCYWRSSPQDCFLRYSSKTSRYKQNSMWWWRIHGGIRQLWDSFLPRSIRSWIWLPSLTLFLMRHLRGPLSMVNMSSAWNDYSRTAPQCLLMSYCGWSSSEPTWRRSSLIKE